MNNNPVKQIILVVIIVLGLSGLYFLLDWLTNKNDVDNGEYLRDHGVNEYIASYISDEDMARIYLNDYIHTMYYNPEEAYNLLDKEYRNIKFDNFNNYKEYVSKLNYSTYDMVRFYKKEIKDYIIFGVYDQNDNFFAFKTKGVMQYSVYLDEETVEIW